jgi:hypothetical protein
MVGRQRKKLKILADPLKFKLKLDLLGMKDGVVCEYAEREWHRFALMCADEGEANKE